MGSGQSAGCRIIDSGKQPDKNNPFNRNMGMVDEIIINKCTTYGPEARDPVTNKITNEGWTKPSCLENGIPYPCNSASTGNLIPPNICFENAAFFGINSNAPHQKNFTSSYCSNISGPEMVDYFRLPQDNMIYRFVKIDLPNSEWQTPSDAFQSLKNYIINVQDAKYSGGFLLKEGYLLSSVKLLSILKNNRPRVRFKLPKKKNADGEDTEETEADDGEVAEDDDLDIIEQMSNRFKAGEAGAEGTLDSEVATESAIAVAEGAGEEAGAEAGAEVAGLAASEGIPGIGQAALVAFVIAGFADDLAQADCSFDSKHEPTLVSNSVKAACCRDSCAIAGKKTKCSRGGGASFNASLFSCCMQDYECYNKNKDGNIRSTIENGQPSSFQRKCFNLANENKGYPRIATCHPDYRSLGGSGCADIIQEYCSGQTPFGIDQTSLLDAWSENGKVKFGNENYEFTVQSPCLNFVARQLTDGVAGLEETICNWQDFLDAKLDLLPENLSPTGLVVVKETISKVVENYVKESGSPVGKINADGYIQSGDFITWLFNICKKYPFLCTDALSSFCFNISADTITNDKTAVEWCGCYMQDKEYSKYTKYNISKQCTPTCNLPDVIPLVSDDGVKIPCTDSVCMIDDVTIKLAQSFTEGPITFNQICGSCGGSKIQKSYNSAYSYLENSSLSKFYSLAPLTVDNYNTVSDSFFYNQTASNFYDQNYRNISRVGFVLLESQNENNYFFNSETSYRIVSVDSGKIFNNVKFNIGTPIVELGTSNLINYISSFTADTITDLNNQNFTDILNPTNFDLNIFKIINNSDNGSPAGDKGYFYFKVEYYETGQHRINNNNDTITQTFLQSVVNEVSQFSSAVEANNCNCTIEGTLDFVNSRINGLELNNNCSNATCRDSDGNRIPCSSNNIDFSNDISIQNSLIASVEDNNFKFESLTESEKQKFISTISLTFFILIVIMNILLTHFPKKYLGIIISFIVIYFLVIFVIYLIYSDSYNIGDITNFI